MPYTTIRLDNVPGENIIFRNFRGKATPLTRPGDRSFCLIIPNRLIRDQLATRGCNIKKLKDIEFVNVAVRFVPPENVDNIWEMLDVNLIDNASLEFTFYEWNINGKKGTRIYLKNARFYVKGFNNNVIIDIHYPGYITCKLDNTNNTEETNMEKMTRAEVIGQLQMGVTAFETNKSLKKDPIVTNLMLAMKNAIEYIGEVPKSEIKVKMTRAEVIGQLQMGITAFKMNKTNDPIVTNLMLAMKNAIEYIGEVPKSEIKVKTVTVEKKVPVLPGIKQVIFNGPATVVIWDDDVKTVVKCQEGDTFDKEKGLAMAICKRLYGNESNFNYRIKRWTEPKTKKAERQAQAEANKTAKGKSKAGKKKALDKARKNVKDTSNVVITDAYVNHVRVKMAKRGIKNYNELAKVSGVSQTCLSRSFGNAKRKSKVMYRSTFNKINKTLGIRWG